MPEGETDPTHQAFCFCPLRLRLSPRSRLIKWPRVKTEGGKLKKKTFLSPGSDGSVGLKDKPEE